MVCGPLAYDEDLELTRFLWSHYGWLLKAAERRALRAAIGEMEAFRRGRRVLLTTEVFRTRAGGVPDEEVCDLLGDAPATYAARTRARLLATHAHRIRVRRCPACDRIVRSAREAACFWCETERPVESVR